MPKFVPGARIVTYILILITLYHNKHYKERTTAGHHGQFLYRAQQRTDHVNV